ncbi:SMI1/KNR4 family protein [Actinacidiphila epipremni]|uniref:SMI1/KNR4 family protein n=1 Tax=Actinacidiphila epipremni TaxID=2053013 RepID=A0ABX0ZJ56_9ACTN|nr:SMI1/KNR4 family protein [Actinacidiphila epipremni]NJP43326.1 SMI1/KNR4 family protein [Actinacidiphila epipremni]
MGERTAWRPFLEQWSAEWIVGHDPAEAPPLDPEVVRDGWLGFAPASEAAVAAAEQRLGRRLPPSLREFLLVTDGWRDAGCFVYRMAGTAELAWLRDTEDRTWIEVYEELAEEALDSSEADGAGDAGDADEDDDVPFEVQEARVLARSLRLSLEGDAAVMLLDPDDVGEDGEWAAYWLASWSGEGPERFDSFADLMRKQWRSFHALRRPPGATRDHWDGVVERARGEALAGGIEAPLALLDEAQAFGRSRAEVLATQLRALLGEWQRHVANLLWNADRVEDLLDGPLFAAELLPLLVRHDRLAARHDLRPLPRLKEHGPAAVKELIEEYEARAAAPGFRLSFGNAEFDAAVHAVVDPLAAHPAFADAADPVRPARDEPVVVRHLTAVMTSGGPVAAAAAAPSPAEARAALLAQAWPALLAAVPLWRPVCADHIAPISLLADPVLARLLTPERARALLATPRG